MCLASKESCMHLPDHSSVDAPTYTLFFFDKENPSFTLPSALVYAQVC